MTEDPIALDRHRGMSAQKATEVRRLLAEVEAKAKGLREQQEALEAQLIAAPSESWPEAAEKARYLLGLLAGTPIAQDARRQKLIANVLQDFTRLCRSSERAGPNQDRRKETPWPTVNSAATAKKRKNPKPKS
jgi:hypothetical protein